jgi:hypothetical protein
VVELIEPDRLRYADLFFHVFAHVEGTRELPASVYSPRYVEWAGRCLGAAATRTLGEDAVALAGAFPTHPALASVQALARLFDDTAALVAVGSRALAELAPTSVDCAASLLHLQRLGEGAELAFCALALELPTFLLLPPPPAPPPALLTQLRALTPLAPGLATSRVGCVRSLDRCGRVWGRVIWVGHPGTELGPSVEHAAWQAAHEATVALLAEQHSELNERAVESAAVERLALAARAAGKQTEHARWFDTPR